MDTIDSRISPGYFHKYKEAILKSFVAIFLMVMTFMSISHADSHFAIGSHQEASQSVIHADSGGSHHDSADSDHAGSCTNCHLGHCPFTLSYPQTLVLGSVAKSNPFNVSQLIPFDFTANLLRPPIG